MRLEPVTGEDPREILRAVRGALHGAGPALGLGLIGDAPAEVPAGTAVVLTTSGSTGVPKSVVLSRDALTASADRWRLFATPAETVEQFDGSAPWGAWVDEATSTATDSAI